MNMSKPLPLPCALCGAEPSSVTSWDECRQMTLTMLSCRSGDCDIANMELWLDIIDYNILQSAITAKVEEETALRVRKSLLDKA